MEWTLLSLHLPVSQGRDNTDEDHTPGYGGTRQKKNVSMNDQLRRSLSLILTFSLSFSLCVTDTHTHTPPNLATHLAMMLLEPLMALSQSSVTVCLTHYHEARTDSLSHVRQLRTFLMGWRYLVIKTGALKRSFMKSLKFIGKDTSLGRLKNMAGSQNTGFQDS